MTHDPLCPWAQENVFNHRGECFLIEGSEPPIDACQLIAKVRADTLDKARSAVSEMFWPTDGTWVSGKTTFDNLGRGCLHAIDALRGES